MDEQQQFNRRHKHDDIESESISPDNLKSFTTETTTPTDAPTRGTFRFGLIDGSYKLLAYIDDAWREFAQVSVIPKTVISSIFEDTRRFRKTAGTSGTFTFGFNGVRLETGTNADGWAELRYNSDNGSIDHKFFTGSPTMSITLYMDALFNTSGAMSGFFGIGTVATAGTGHTFTNNHIGFKIVNAGGGSDVATLYATQSDGTETASSALTTLANGDVLELLFSVTGSSSVSYYYRKNGGSLSSATTLTTHIPTSDVGDLQFSISHDSATNDVRLTASSFNYQR